MALPTFVPELSSLPPLPTGDSSVSDLCARYSIARQSLYPRLNACGVSGEKRSHRTFFSPADVFRLDACHHYLGLGYGLKEVAMASVGDDSSDPVEVPAVRSVSSPSDSLAVLGDVIAEAIGRRESSPLDVYRQLAEAADQSFVLTTSVLASILNLSHSTLHGWNRHEERLGFVFRRSGQGRWVVSRQSVSF